MGNLRRLLVAAVGAASLVGAGAVGVSAHEGRTLVEFDSMTGVTVAGINVVNDRGIKAGGAPWVIASGSGEVDRKGNVEVQVRGLIIPVFSPPSNPAPNFRATVSCLTPHGVVNVTTGPFKATMTGNATIDGSVTLPRHCEDPIVFVGFTNPTTGAFVWFAESNAEDRE